MSVLIKGGRVITAADDYLADVYIDGEQITLIGKDLDLHADKVIDASGKYLLPGAVDPHTHLEMPWRGETTIDDFRTGQTAAAFGGTTTHVDFCIQGKGQTFGEALEIWHGKREGKAVIDNGFHIAVTDLREGGTLEELARLPDEHGVTSYKLFMAYKDSLMVDDETLFKTMQVAAETGALVMVHAENGDAIEVLMGEAIAAGNTRPRAKRRTARSSSRASRAPSSTSCTSRARSPSSRSRSRATRAGTSGARPARSTSSSISRSSRSPASKARSTFTRRRPGRRRTRRSSGTPCAPTCCRRSRPTIARTCSKARRTQARTTSARSQTAGPASRTVCS
jgi:hypothetical protein